MILRSTRNLFPDFYSYNFDQVNLLVLPLERKSFMNKLDYQLTEKVKVFGSVGLDQLLSDHCTGSNTVPDHPDPRSWRY